MLTAEEVWQLLDQVKDPEIPVVSVVDLGLIRSVGIAGSSIHIIMTPTFTGCPALEVMRSAIVERLQAAGAQEVAVRLTLRPPWSTDWITSQGRQNLEKFGLAPPPVHAGRLEAVLDAPTACPHCSSLNTERKNDFGSTLCRAIYVCRDCRQPFEGFKPI
jgi:ring-1,2-phenylacetyl-CoA epoxidase subunit PaaD